MPLLELQAQAAHVLVQCQLEENLPKVLADHVLLEQVLLNLTRNAIEAMSHCAPEQRLLRIVAKQSDDLNSVVVEVIDRGHGITSEIAQQLFSPFFSTKISGMGMGLNLCRSIVESHQGRISVENIYNGSEVTGCKFSFWLPLAAPDNHATNSVATAPHSTTPKDS